MKLITVLCASLNVQAITWLTMSEQKVWHPEMCGMVKFHLSLKQQAICRKNINVMRFVSQSAQLTKQECISKFADHRWNCVSIKHAPYFKPDLVSGTREAAFVKALSAASLAYTIASQCATGNIKNCACKNAFAYGKIRYPQKVCDSLLNKGIAFARAFTEPGRKKLKKVQQRSKQKLALIKLNGHNRNVGYKVLSEIKETKCICPGSTGACQIKTCYQTLPMFQVITKELKRRYSEATDARLHPKHGLFRSVEKIKISTDKLVFSDKSIDPCNTTQPIYQVTGRKCSLDPNAPNFCERYCCRGNYESRKEVVRRKCNCVFQWCCEINCDICFDNAVLHFCK